MALSMKAFVLTDAREKALLENRPAIVKHLELSPLLLSILRSDDTLTEQMQNEVEVRSSLC